MSIFNRTQVIKVKSDKNEYFGFPIRSIHSLTRFEKYNKYNFEDFICGVLNEQILIDENILYNYDHLNFITVNSHIEKQILQNGLFETSKDYHVEKLRDDVYRIPSDSTSSSTLLLYYLKEGFVCSDDDFNGGYIVVKASKMLENDPLNGK